MSHNHRRDSMPRSRSGFTRWEFLVVLAVGAVLTALITPAVQQAREAARRSQCKNNLKMLGLGLHNYHEVHESFPYGCVGNPSLPPEERWSWYTFLGPQMAQVGYPRVDLNAAWDDASIRPLMAHGRKNPDDPEFRPLIPYPVLNCPNAMPRSHSDGQPYTDYVGIAGTSRLGPTVSRISSLAGAWAYDEVTRNEDVSDGLSHTLFVMETLQDTGCWLSGGPPTVRPFELMKGRPVGNPGQFGGLHPGGGIALFMDGEVRMIADGIDVSAFRPLVTIAAYDRAETP